jgi:hypothetical protein
MAMADTPESGAINDAYRSAIQSLFNQEFAALTSGDTPDQAIQRFRVGVQDARTARDRALAVLAEGNPPRRFFKLPFNLFRP